MGIIFPTDYYVYLKKGYSSAGNDRKGLDGFYGKYIFTVRGIYMGERLDMLSTTEAVKYGFSMIWYFIATGSASMILILVGRELIGISLLLGIIMYFAGIILLLSATYGAIYKLQSDSVTRGNIQAVRYLNTEKSQVEWRHQQRKNEVPPPPPESY